METKKISAIAIISAQKETPKKIHKFQKIHKIQTESGLGPREPTAN